MAGYTKLFSSILESTVWLQSPQTKVVWITMLVMVDRNGEVQASIPGLAKRSGVSVKDCEKALAIFMAPDAYSRTATHEGRRVTAVTGGWRILNYMAYRNRLDREIQRDKAAARQRKSRANRSISAPACDRGVTVTPIAPGHTIATATAAAEKKEEHGVVTPWRATFDRFWVAYPKRTGRKEAERWWASVQPIEAFAAQIVAGAEAYGRKVHDYEARYIKSAVRWLEGALWEDYEWPVDTPVGSVVKVTALSSLTEVCQHQPPCGSWGQHDVKSRLETGSRRAG